MITTRNLDYILKNNSVTKQFFVGTYPSCTQPISNRETYAFITNTDEHDTDGEHWNCWWVHGDKVIFFDSFGRAPYDSCFPSHYTDIIDRFQNVEYSGLQIQGLKSKACGYFCIHFIYIFSLGLDFKSFFSDYCNNHEINDMLVYDIVDSLT